MKKLLVHNKKKVRNKKKVDMNTDRTWVTKGCLAMMALLLASTMACKEYFYDFDNGYTSTDFPDTVTVEIDSNMFRVDRSKFAQATVFPGLIDVDEPRLTEHSVMIDLDYEDVPPGDIR